MMGNEKIIGIDYGAKRIGVAIGFLENNLSLPYTIIDNKGKDFVLGEIQKIIESEDISFIVMGMPHSLSSGEESAQYKEVKSFKEFLEKNIDIKIVEEDERYTSKMASDLLIDEKKRRQDDVAASIILQSYFDKKK